MNSSLDHSFMIRIFRSRGDWAFQPYRRLCSILKIRTNAGKHIPFSAVERLTNDLSWKLSMRAGRALSNGIVMFCRAGFRCWSELITVGKILTSSCKWGCDFECECETLWDCNCCKQAHVNPPLWIDRDSVWDIQAALKTLFHEILLSSYYPGGGSR